MAKGKDGTECTDSLRWIYRTDKWGAENGLRVTHTPIDNDMERIEVTVVDSNGTSCLDSRRFIRFDITGDGALIKNLGTAGGSSKVQAADGMASICMRKNSGRSAVSISSESMTTQIIFIE